MATLDPEVTSVVERMASGFSKHSSYSNKLWLAVVGIAAVLLFPNREGELIKLPFDLGSVHQSVYGPIGFIILTILTLAFCQGYAQAHLVARQAQTFINKVTPANREDARDLYDMLTTSSFARVAPLALLLKAQFPTADHTLVLFYYATLKIIGNAVLLGLPGIALILSYRQFSGTSSALINSIAILGLVSTTAAMLLVLYAEINHATRTRPRFQR
jgi:hypothetical protein